MISKNILFSLSLGWPSYLNAEIQKFDSLLKQDSAAEMIRRGLQEKTDISVRSLSGFQESEDRIEFDKRIRFMRKFLHEKMYIDSAEDLLSAIRFYCAGSNYSAYLADLFTKAAASKNIYGDKDVSIVQSKDFFSAKLFIYKNAGFFANPTFRAYDISTAVLLCRFGLYLEWLKLEHAVKIMEEIAADMCQKYSSFEEYFTEGAVAQAFFNKDFYVNDLYFKILGDYGSYERFFIEFY